MVSKKILLFHLSMVSLGHGNYFLSSQFLIPAKSIHTDHALTKSQMIMTNFKIQCFLDHVYPMSHGFYLSYFYSCLKERLKSQNM